MERDKAVSDFRLALQTRYDRPELRAPDGSSTIVLRVESDPGAAWRNVQWIMQAAAHPGVRIYKLELRCAGDADCAPVTLPRDAGLSVDGGILVGDVHVDQEYDKLKLTFVRENRAEIDAQTKLRIDHGESFLFPSSERVDDKGFAKVSAVVEKLVKDRLESELHKPEVVEIAAPPPAGGAVPVEHVLHVYRMIRSLGHEVFLFDGAPLR